MPVWKLSSDKSVEFNPQMTVGQWIMLLEKLDPEQYIDFLDGWGGQSIYVKDIRNTDDFFYTTIVLDGM